MDEREGVQGMSTTTEAPPTQAASLELRYFTMAGDLLGEILSGYGKLLRQPDGPRGQVILKLEQMAAALRNEPFKPVMDWDRRLHQASPQLLDLAEKLLNDQKNGIVTDSSIELASLLLELRR
jgi:hypothetical protein